MTRQVVTTVCYQDPIPGKAKSDPEGAASAATLTHFLDGGVKTSNQLLSLTNSGLSRILPRSPKFCRGVCLSLGVLEFCPHLQKAIPIQPLLEAIFNKSVFRFTGLLLPGVEPEVS